MRSLKLALAFLLLASASLFAADKPAFFVLHQELVPPAATASYEQCVKDFASLVTQHHDKSPDFSFMAFSGTDSVYSFVTPIQGFATLDSINSGFWALAEAAGPKWTDLMKKSVGTVDYVRESVLMDDPSLSYTPAQPRLKPEEERFFHFDLYYVQYGREAEALDLAREFAALFRKKGMPDGYRFLQTVMGPEMPLMVVVTKARDAADYATQDAKMREMLGAEGERLFQRAASLCRRFDQKEAWVRPDLSLKPIDAAMAGR